jgi:hypothetical protein
LSELRSHSRYFRRTNKITNNLNLFVML